MVLLLLLHLQVFKPFFLSYSLNNSPHNWFVDFGSNEHICSFLHYFSSYCCINYVHLLNGTYVTIHHVGTVVFYPCFHNSNVLYSPHFNVNLISVSKICLILNCFVHLFPDKYVIHDVNSHKMIGLVDHCDGLYKLRIQPSPHVMSFFSFYS